MSSTSDTPAARVTAQFEDVQGRRLGPPLALPAEVVPEQLDILLQQLLRQEPQHGDAEDDSRKYAYFIEDRQILRSIQEDVVDAGTGGGHEALLRITYRPQSLFKVQCVQRCSSSLSGHAEAVLSVAFSPDGRRLASGSGDATVRFWDLDTETPHASAAAKVHTDWVLCIAWSSDAQYLASGSMDHSVQVWRVDAAGAGQPHGRRLLGHKGYITSLAWQPYHCREDGWLASASKDGLVKVWHAGGGVCLHTLAGHTDMVTMLRWGVSDHLYSASRDKTIRVWRMAEPAPGRSVGVLHGHAHWVNTLSLSTDYFCRIGPFHPCAPAAAATAGLSGARVDAAALRQCRAAMAGPADTESEWLVSGSDDFTLLLWKAPLRDSAAGPRSAAVRMTGHQGIISQVAFSPNACWLGAQAGVAALIASASFDKSIRVWDARSGQLLHALRGHTQAIYQLAWAPMDILGGTSAAPAHLYLVSGAKDATLKVWAVPSTARAAKRGSDGAARLKLSLPGHLDEVFSVDWSPDGTRVASGSKDKTLKVWRR